MCACGRGEGKGFTAARQPHTMADCQGWELPGTMKLCYLVAMTINHQLPDHSATLQDSLRLSEWQGTGKWRHG